MSSALARSRGKHDPEITGSTGDAVVAAPDAGVHRGPLDQLARRVLGLRDAEPRALFDLQGSLILSCIRCILTYVVIPIAVPLVNWAEVVATPLSLLLSVAAIGFAVRSLRRVWQADWRHRWAYTGFIAVVVGLLVVGIGFDLRTLLA